MSQGDLFALHPDALPAKPPAPRKDHAPGVRKKVQGLLDELRAADTMPWDEDKIGYW